MSSLSSSVGTWPHTSRGHVIKDVDNPEDSPDSSESSIEVLECIAPKGGAPPGTSIRQVVTELETAPPTAKSQSGATSAEDMDISDAGTHKASGVESAITLEKEQSEGSTQGTSPRQAQSEGGTTGTPSRQAPSANDSELSDGEVRDDDGDNNDDDDQGGAGATSGVVGDDTLTHQEEERILGRSTPHDRQIQGTEDDILGHPHDQVSKGTNPSLCLLSPPRSTKGSGTSGQPRSQGVAPDPPPKKQVPNLKGPSKAARSCVLDEQPTKPKPKSTGVRQEPAATKSKTTGRYS